jgi:hypothetical protein
VRGPYLGQRVPLPQCHNGLYVPPSEGGREMSNLPSPFHGSNSSPSNGLANSVFQYWWTLNIMICEGLSHDRTRNSYYYLRFPEPCTTQQGNTWDVTGRTGSPGMCGNPGPVRGRVARVYTLARGLVHTCSSERHFRPTFLVQGTWYSWSRTSVGREFQERLASREIKEGTKTAGYTHSGPLEVTHE